MWALERTCHTCACLCIHVCVCVYTCVLVMLQRECHYPHVTLRKLKYRDIKVISKATHFEEQRFKPGSAELKIH